MAYYRRRYYRSYRRRRAKKVPKIYVNNPTTGKPVLIKTLITQVRKAPGKYKKFHQKPKAKPVKAIEPSTGDLVTIAEVNRKKRKAAAPAPAEVPLPPVP